MSLVKCETTYEEGKYRDFNFAIRVLYDPENNPQSGIIYIKENQNRIGEVFLPIEIKTLSKFWSMERPINVDFSPLETSATKSHFIIEDLEGLLKEITRKFKLTSAIKNPEKSFLKYENVAPFLNTYPELTKDEYLEKIPEDKRHQIRVFLEKE